MAVLNRIRLSNIFISFAFGAAIAAFGGYAAAQEQPMDAPQADAAGEPSGETTDEQPLGQTLATIDGEAITEADIAVLAQDFADQLRRLPRERHVPELLNNVIQIRLLANAAEEAGIDKEDLTMRRIEFERSRILRSEFLRQLIETAVTDQTVRARYDEEIANFEPEDELRLRHILVDTEAESREVITEIEEGGDFATIAGEKSKDPGSAAKGGELDFIPRGRTVPPFEAAAFALEVGEFTKEPVQTQFGWHVIRLEEKRKTKPPEFAADESRIRNLMVGEVITEKVEELSAAAEIEIFPPAP